MPPPPVIPRLLNGLLTLMPNMKLKKLPYIHYSYGDAQPVKPLGQIELLYEWNKIFQTLTFQVRSRDTMINKPTILSGSDCEKLGLIKITADEIFS